MVLDKLIYHNKIKALIITIYFIYVIIWGTVLKVNFPLNLNNHEVHEKEIHTMKKGVALLGGSNVRSGLSAEYISNKFIECYNFGISSEGGSFSEYTYFIGDRISSPDVVIYSSYFLWSDLPDQINYLDFIPPYSIISQINAFLHRSNRIKSNFNSFGDQLVYPSYQNYLPFEINEQKFAINNSNVVNEIILRVKKIKNITHCDKVLIRIPPVYVKREDKKFINQTMKKRIKMLKDSGVIVIGETICSTDKSLFYDNFHPNNKGRNFFSNELINEIKKIQN